MAYRCQVIQPSGGVRAAPLFMHCPRRSVKMTSTATDSAFIGIHQERHVADRQRDQQSGTECQIHNDCMDETRSPLQLMLDGAGYTGDLIPPDSRAVLRAQQFANSAAAHGSEDADQHTPCPGSTHVHCRCAATTRPPHLSQPRSPSSATIGELGCCARGSDDADRRGATHRIVGNTDTPYRGDNNKCF